MDIAPKKPAIMAMRHELRRKIRASKANTSAMPNSPRMMYQGVNGDHSATGVLPPVNPSGHFFVERNVDRAEYRDDEQTELAKTLPQSQAYVSELHRHNFPRQRHPERRPPDHQSATDRVIQGARVIDEPRITGKLGDSNYESEHEKSREQCISLCEYKTEEQTIIDKIERRPGAPIRPRREREQ